MPAEPIQSGLIGEGDLAAMRAAFPPDGDPDRALLAPDCALLKLQKKVIVGRADTPIGSLFIKRYNVFAARIALGSIGRVSPAVRAGRNATRLAALGFGVPVVVAAVEERRAGLVRRSFFVTHEAAGLTADLWWQRAPAGARRHAARSAGALFRRLHECGVYHADLKDVNLLVHGTGDALDWTLLDLERVRFGPLGDGKRLTNVTQLARTVGRHASRTDQLRFLRAYLGAAATPTVVRTWIGRIARKVAAKDRGKVPQATAVAAISAAIVCQNEERHIRRCLESVGWSAERIVIDGGSHDRTREIAHECAAQVTQHAWPGYRAQKQFAFERTTQPWVLSLDADERVTPELAAEMRRAVECAPATVDGFAIPRWVPYLGRWWYRGGWYPRRVIRLVRRERARWAGVDPHDRLEVPGTVLPLTYPLVHYTYADVAAHLRTVVRFSEVAAAERAGRAVGAGRLLGEPCWRFLRSWVLRAGWREGFPGFFVAATDAFYTFLRFAIMHQQRRTAKRK
jgi:Lipopolysaccharide kinase (Kdo/WaaP) family/Glycosyl transferase family 2